MNPTEHPSAALAVHRTIQPASRTQLSLLVEDSIQRLIPNPFESPDTEQATLHGDPVSDIDPIPEHFASLPEPRSWRCFPELPAPRNGGALGTANVPLAQIRLVQRELDTGSLDLRTVIGHCQRFDPGSPEFRKAYMDARIGVLEKRHVRQERHRLPFGMAIPAAPVESPFVPTPFNVVNLADLFRHLGIWVLLVGVLELWNSYQIALVLDGYLLGGVPFLALATAFVFFGINSILWLRLRGRHIVRFTMPGFVLTSLLALLAAGFHIHSAIAGLISGDPVLR